MDTIGESMNADLGLLPMALHHASIDNLLNGINDRLERLRALKSEEMRLIRSAIHESDAAEDRHSALVLLHYMERINDIRMRHAAA